MTTGKTIALTRWTFVGKVMSLLLNMLYSLAITFLSRSRRLLISWLQSPSSVILESKKIKPVTVFIVSPSICHGVVRLGVMILVFWMLSFQPAFPLSSFTFIERLFSSSSLSAIRVMLLVECAISSVLSCCSKNLKRWMNRCYSSVFLGKTKDSTSSRSEAGLTQKTR